MKCAKIRTFHSRLVDVDDDVEICEGREGGGESKELMERKSMSSLCSPDSVNARLPSPRKKKFKYIKKLKYYQTFASMSKS
jgi:hypothetical protein